ncbi:MAG: sensor histidine kinase [Actinomycetota bacterium]
MDQKTVARQTMDRRVLRSTRGFFDGKSPLLVAVLGLAFIAVVSVLDYLTGPDLSLSLLYLMPIGLVTWNLGRRWGAVAVVISTVAALVSDVLSSPSTTTTDPVPYWNGIVRFAVFLAAAMLLDTLRSIIDAQWGLVEEETGRSSDLREMNDVKDTLLHAVSHDLKGPLAGILGAMQTIRRDDELHLTGDERQALYEVIEHSGRKMNRLIDDLLDLDRIDRGKVHPQRRPTDVGELARRVVADAAQLDDHPVRVRADAVMVEVDPGKVERVIENLLVNAARYTPPGTAVLVQITSRPNGIDLVVEDDGPGIPDELKDVLFEPFRQGEDSSGRGMGIGLSLVQRFAELHGGTARIEDAATGGARFVVELPGEVAPIGKATDGMVAEPQLHAV